MKKPPTKPMKPATKPPFPPKKGAEPDADDKMRKDTRPGRFGPVKKIGF